MAGNVKGTSSQTSMNTEYQGMMGVTVRPENNVVSEIHAGKDMLENGGKAGSVFSNNNTEKDGIIEASKSNNMIKTLDSKKRKIDSGIGQDSVLGFNMEIAIETVEGIIENIDQDGLVVSKN